MDGKTAEKGEMEREDGENDGETAKEVDRGNYESKNEKEEMEGRRELLRKCRE